jgi:Protein of unknown function (DUF3168)
VIADGLYAVLASAGAVIDIVGTPQTRTEQMKTTGIFKVQMPEGAAMPAVVFSQIAGESLMTMDGPDPLRFVRYQFNCYGKSPADAAALQRAVRRTLENFTGTMADGSQVDDMECVLEMETFEDAPFLFNASVDMRIAFRDLGT